MNWRTRAGLWVDRLNVWVSWFCYALLIGITCIASAQVVLRYFLNRPTSWSEEVALLCLIWFGLMAVAISIRRHEHLAITFIRDMLPRPLGRALDYMAQILVGGFMLVVMFYGRDLVALAGIQVLPASGLPKFWLYVPTLVGGGLGAFNALANLVLGQIEPSPHMTMDEYDAG